MPGNTPIAVIGLSYRAPGVGRKDLFEYLAEAKSAWSRVPRDRFDQDALYDPKPEKAGCISSKGAHFLPDDIYSFDAAFFNLKVEEARAMDPQHRMMLECAFEATESAGLNLHEVAGLDYGVFSAIGSTDYIQQIADDVPSTTAWASAGSAPCMFANRLSYFFNLTGPSIALDAACASSAYALHLACKSLGARDCSAAFVGASSLLMNANQWTFLENMGALSPEGKSYSYDVKASGYGRGEGGACLIVKRLDDAVESGDPIHAIISNSVCNHSGRSDGITMPRQAAQQDLLLRVHHEIGLDPGDTPVIEGHGTGTKVGDPIEAGAFANTLAAKRTAANPLYIGSLKSNFGHLEAASGILGVVKAIVMLKHGYILPNANFQQLHPSIQGRENLKVAPKALKWPQEAARRVCVTNFGFGGSNAAILLEGFDASKIAHDVAPKQSPELLTNGDHARNSARLIVLTAKCERSLKSYIPSFLGFLDTVTETPSFVNDLSFTLGQRRTHLAYRVAIVGSSASELKARLSTEKIHRVQKRVIAFVFPGQGAQYPEMANNLGHFPSFSHALEQAEICLQSLGAPWSLREELFAPKDKSRINEPDISQPACTAVQVALVVLLRSWGVSPDLVTGHSSGEIAAAFAAGMINFQTALAVAYFRGLAVAEATGGGRSNGAMLALGVDSAAATALLARNSSGYATIAAINSPDSVTLSGDEEAIAEIQKMAEADGLFARRLTVSVAYHSRHMEQSAARYLELMTLSSQNDRIEGLDDPSHATFVSSVTGEVMAEGPPEVSYWISNLLQPVGFLGALKKMFSGDSETPGAYEEAKSPNTVVEIGPHSSLKSPITQTLKVLRQESPIRMKNVTYLPSLVRGEDNHESLLSLAGSLFTTGVKINLAMVNKTSKRTARVVTDTPPYAWDMSMRFLAQPRITREKLFPDRPYNPLIGWKSPYDEGDTISFRQVIAPEDLPWSRNFGGSLGETFPVPGLLSMAVEALKSVSSSPPCTIRLRDLDFKQSLVLNPEEKLDLTIKLEPTATKTTSSDIWDFEILSWSQKDNWISHLQGFIESISSRMTMANPVVKASAEILDSTTVKEINGQQNISLSARSGFQHLESLLPTMELAKGPGFAVIEIKSSDNDISLDAYSLLHSLFQGASYLEQGPNSKAMWALNKASRVRVSSDLTLSKENRLVVVSRLLGSDPVSGKMHTDVAAFLIGQSSVIPVADCEAMEFESLKSDCLEDPTADIPRSYAWDLVPSLDLVSENQFTELLSGRNFGEKELEHRRRLDLAALFYLKQALKQITVHEVPHMPIHFQKFLAWAQTVVEKQKPVFDDFFAITLAKTALFDAQGEFVCAIGRKLVSILRGEEELLGLMVKDQLLTRHYEQDKANIRGSQMLAECAHWLSKTKPNMRVLEIGGGTASASLPILKALSSIDSPEVPALLDYTFTDISSGFFENARSKLAKWARHIKYKRLDISKDPAAQDFDLGQYDVVVASNCLHATSDMGDTMRHVKSLLKPHGKLLMLEAVLYPPLILPFALLPGWWLAADGYRRPEDGPLLSIESWQRLLCDSGFSDVKSAVADYPNTPEHMFQLFCATNQAHSNEALSAVTLCHSTPEATQLSFTQTLSETVHRQLGIASSVKHFVDLSTDDPLCVVIDGPDHSIVKEMTAESFEKLKTTLMSTPKLLWVIPAQSKPETGAIKGILRTLRQEYDSKQVFLFENVPLTEQGAQAVTQLVKRLREPGYPRDHDQEFTWHDDMTRLPRLRLVPEAEDNFASEAGISTKSLQPLWQNGHPLELTVDAAGDLDSCYFRQNKDTLRDDALGNDQILVKNEAVGLNLRDVDLLLGSLPWTTPGFEGVGVIVDRGSCVHDLEIGDRVFYCAFEGGSISTHPIISSLGASKIPEGMSSTDAATIPIAFITSVMALTRVARLEKGENVLIHGASSAIGQACIMLSQHLGAEVFVTADTPAKCSFLHETFHISNERILSGESSELRETLLGLTGGVDVILNVIPGNSRPELVEAIAEFGRFVDLGAEGSVDKRLAIRASAQNVTFSCLDLHTWFAKKPTHLRECMSVVSTLLQQKLIRPILPVTQFSVSQLRTALGELQSNENTVQAVLTMGPEERVTAERRLPPPQSLSQLLSLDATYLITGGTRGIGLALASWMIDNGAQNIVLLGLSGSSRPEVKALLERHHKDQVNIRAIACNVGSKEDLAHALHEARDLPPIRGVIHGALTLRDALLENATYEDWQKVTTPRIQGSWHLHDLLPGLDFFISLSSFLGSTGNVGQSIYAATASFLDSFATYRNAQGFPAVTIDLPVMLDVGFVADRDMSDTLRRSLGVNLTEFHLRTLVKGAIMGSASNLNHAGRAVSFNVASRNGNKALPWKYFHPSQLVQHINSDQFEAGGEQSQNPHGDSSLPRQSNLDPLSSLIESLISKVSEIMMVDREEIEPDVPLSVYGLDSLVSVELRNWIRRETGVEAPLTEIVGAENLRAMATIVHARKG
ncbi:polyketide synthase [Penicillium capsulatum]|uniref:Polyketide synthase n=1 Tax=Penicillium capsulatum TaxID=69766 RepID=A0A9W9LH12_9EURO|nr:polyketide synthase [Penicillium capsulatum]KAJ6107010.1 polyketide synthase [Penicillium capsulatum]